MACHLTNTTTGWFLQPKIIEAGLVNAQGLSVRACTGALSNKLQGRSSPLIVTNPSNHRHFPPRMYAFWMIHDVMLTNCIHKLAMLCEQEVL